MGDKKRILVVDDSIPPLKLVSEMLLYNGYDIIKTTSGKKAVVLAVEYEPDLLILDLMMPYVDGIKVIELVRKFDFLKDKPIIMLTASSNKEDVKKSRELGVAKYMLKPVSINSFVETIRNILPKDNYDDMGVYLNGDNFINEPDTDDNIKPVLEECEKIIHNKNKSEKINVVLEKESRSTDITVIDGYPVKPVNLLELKEGMIPGRQIKSKGGMIIHPAGVALNNKIIKKIQSDDFELEHDTIYIRG